MRSPRAPPLGPRTDKVRTVATPEQAVATALIDAARKSGLSLGLAESLTGGGVSTALVSVPGASDVYRGAIVSYALDVKRDVLGVEASLLSDPGPVSSEVAVAMAAGTQRLLGCDIAIATTGVAGPDAHGGQPPGTAWIAAARGTEAWAKRVQVEGDREAVIVGVTAAALTFAHGIVESPGRMATWKLGTQLR